MSLDIEFNFESDYNIDFSFIHEGSSEFEWILESGYWNPNGAWVPGSTWKE